MSSTILIVLIWIFLLAIDLIAIGARVSILEISHARLLGLREQAGAKASKTLALLPEIPRVRASLNLLLVSLRFALAGLAIYLLLDWSLERPLLWAIILLVLLALVVFWLEWLVERRAIRSPESWAMRLTSFTRFWMFIEAFLLMPLSISKTPEVSGESTPGAVTEDELKSMVDASQEDGVLELGERQMIYSVFELGETLAREIMVPRIDIQALDVNTPLPEAVDALLQSGHSRVPVYEENIDNALGLLYAKELLRAWREDLDQTSLRGLLRPAYFVPEAKKVDALLAEMQSKRIHMAIVVDEYGGVAGLVTLEDIVEEIFGEIQDEYDGAEEAPYQQLPDGSYIFLGRVDLDDINELMGSNLPDDEADTLGGYIYHRLGHVPGIGEKVRVGNLVLTVVQVSGRRIKKVSAQIAPSDPQDGGDEIDVDK